MVVLLLSGWSTSGKDTVAALLQTYYGFQRYAFADILKEIVAEDLLRSLQKKGLINSYEDDETEEVFFLSDLGKKEIHNLTDIEDVKGLRVFLDNDEEDE